MNGLDAARAACGSWRCGCQGIDGIARYAPPEWREWYARQSGDRAG